VIRRFIENRSLFAADRGHIHHRLLDMGVTHRRAVLILYGFTVTLVVLALLLYIGRKWEVGLVLALMVVAFAVFARIVGVFEYFNRRKLSRAGLLSGHAERLRRSIAPLLMQADAVQAWDQVQPLLEDLCRRVEFVSAGVEFDTPDLPTVRCGKDAPQRDGRKRLLVAALPLQKSGAEFGRLVCSWYSERGRVTPETEILLQVLADRLAERLPRA
jgi:UDP-GlcNAc:undecaprenyl-phosphate GlcNAc-1-phosphate transferase